MEIFREKINIEDLKSSPLYMSLSDDIARARKILQLYIAAGDDYYSYVRKQVGILTRLRLLRRSYLDLHLKMLKIIKRSSIFK